MENTTNQPEISLVNILNALKKNVLTIVYVLLSALLVGLLYTVIQPPEYFSSASLVSKTPINATTEPQITSTLVGDNFLSGVVNTLAEGNITKLEGETITKERIGSALSGKLLSENGVLYDITFVSKDKKVIVQILTVVRSEFLEYLKADETLNAIGNNLELIAAPTEPANIGIGRTMIFVIAGVVGILISVVVVFVADVWKGAIYDKRDINSDNLVELKMPKQYKKITIRNFMSWPSPPVNISEALTKGDNKKALNKIQNSIIAKSGFDNNVQVFYATTTKNVHDEFIEAYAANFVNNGKKVIVINLDESDGEFLNLIEEMNRGEAPRGEDQSYAASNPKRLIVLSLDKSNEKPLKSNEKISKGEKPQVKEKTYPVVGIKGEQYPSGIVNNVAFVNYISKLKKDYDFIIISAGTKLEEYKVILSKLSVPIVNVYSEYTSKKDYRRAIYKLNQQNTITLIVD